jgi:hypothetical protein
MDLAVEFARSGKGDVIDVQIEPHADRIRRHQEINVTGLVQRDLSITRARAQGPEHDRGAAALAAQQLGNGINLACRKGDDCRARRKPRNLLIAGIRELR